jgi:hypothetical protein
MRQTIFFLLAAVLMLQGCIVVSSNTTTGPASVRVSWTVGGQTPTLGCGMAGVTKVTVSLLNDTDTQILQKADLDCASGTATLANVLPGKRYLRIDGFNAKGELTYGTLQDHGPFIVDPGIQFVVANTLDVADLRTTVTLDWGFPAGFDCNNSGTASMMVQVSDGKTGAVIVPYTDLDAKKPCNIGFQPAAVRSIDLEKVGGVCNIPPGARGLVICHIKQSSLSVSVLALDGLGTPIFGGAQLIDNLPMGKDVNISQPLPLMSCAQVQCTK